jgi:elongation factor Ts
MEITAADVMKLRNKTGLSMMECKSALVEAKGDQSAAEDLLRKKMKGKMDSKEAKPAGEGRIAVAIAPGNASAAIIELRANTDFTAKNDLFIALAQKIADGALKQPVGKLSGVGDAQGALDDLRIKTGEQLQMARGEHIAGGAGTVFGFYVHHDGKTGVLLKGAGVTPELLKDLGMHVVANPITPKGVSAADVPAEVIEKERKFRIEQAMESGKPKDIAEKIVEGGMRKFFEDVALIEQPFIKDPTKKVKDLLGKGTIHGFWRWAVGEQA